MDDRPNLEKDWMTSNKYRFHLVEKVSQVEQFVNAAIKRGLSSLDLETTGVDNRIYSDSYFDDGRETRYGFRTVDKIAGISVSFNGEDGYYIPVGHLPEDSGNLPWDETFSHIERLCKNCRIIFHNAKFDQTFLQPVINKAFWKVEEYEDTYLMAKIINPLKGHPAGLKPLTKKHFGIDMIDLQDLFTAEKLKELKRDGQGLNFSVLHPKEGRVYASSDAIFTYCLLSVLKEKLDTNDIIYRLEKNFCNIIREMENNRVHVDTDRLKFLQGECKNALEDVADIIRGEIESRTGRSKKWLTLNIGSPKQLSQALLTDDEGLRLKPTAEMLATPENMNQSSSDDDDEEEETGSGDDDKQKQFSLKDEALKSLHRAYGKNFLIQRDGHVDKEGKPKQESIFELIIEWRHYQKMAGSYVEPLLLSHDKYGDVRPLFNQMGTDTARLSSAAGKIKDGYSGINFQGIPRDSDEDKPDLFKQIRTCIIPRPGFMLVKLDFAGEELRVVTNLSGDPIWTDSFLNKDGDVHSITARTLFKKSEVNKDERNRGKRCNFAFIYGGGAGAIQRNIGCTIEEAQRHMANLKSDVPVLMGYVDHQKHYARKHKCIYTAYGRRIPIEHIDSPIRGLKAKAERCAINFTIQSTSADILKLAMVLVDKNLRDLGWKDRCRYVLTVHDEVVFEIKPEYLMEIVRKLDEWMTLPWKLPKAHGRQWVVPLLTEPGIDINWKARFDYFKMVDGVPANKKEIDSDGKFTGKLKKDEYFHGGRIYQKVPDFLESYIHRLERAEQPKTDDVSGAATPVSTSESSTQEEAPISIVEVKDVKSEVQEAPSPKEFATEDSTKPSLTSPIQLVEEKPTPVAEKLQTSEPVLRWSISSPLNKFNMRKLHAVCILSEGKTPLRVISSKGDVLIAEDSGVLIEKDLFLLLVRLFGL